MTFLSLACKGDSAEIVTDTGSYTLEDTKVRKTTKIHPFHHLDAVLTSSGHAGFTYGAFLKSQTATLQADSFDDLIDTAEPWLRAAAEEAGIDPTAVTAGAADVMSGTVMLVGYSERLDEYAAYKFTPANLTGERIEELHVNPMPFTRRLPKDQLQRIVKGLRNAGLPEEDASLLYRNWGSAPKVTIPESDDDWIELVRLAREERSLQGPLLRVHVTGPIMHTRMTRGSIHTRKIYEFPDEKDPALLAQMFLGSWHPIAQVNPCGWCDSGKLAIDCCLQQELNNPCDCGAQRTFGECCAVTDKSAVDRTSLWTSKFDW